MYSGTTVRTKSGLVLGAHQQIDRLARRHLTKHLPKKFFFPHISEILHFEGLNGPDGVKRKSPGRDEPWHYINPANPDDMALFGMIADHIQNLAKALQDKNNERAAFEAAWMAHAITDGLTPAHHYPLDDKIEELWGKPREERLSVRDKNIIRGKNRRDTLLKNWEYWGARGIFTNHFMFEWGVATSMRTLRAENVTPSGNSFVRVENEGFRVVFEEIVHTVYDLNMFNEFCDRGWNRHLANETRNKLVPLIVEAVCLGWYEAVLIAERRGK